MNETTRAMLLHCACCPNPCRRNVPADHATQRESETPSALALIALSVADGALAADDATLDALSRTEVAHLCRPACPYGFDIAGTVDGFRAALESAR